MWVVRQADDSFVCFGAKPEKGFGLEISTRPEVGRERESLSWKKEPTEGSWRRETQGGRRPVDTGHLRDQSDEIGSSRSEGRPVKMSRHSSWVVEFSLEIHGSVSLHMHIGNAMLHNSSFLHLVLTQAHFVRLFFILSSHSLDCISCSHEEMCNTPIGTTRWSPVKKWNGLKKLI